MSFTTSTPISTRNILNLDNEKDKIEEEDNNNNNNVEQIISNEEEFRQKYMTIEDLFNQYPLEKAKLISIYGIIKSFDFNTRKMTLMDDTRKKLVVNTFNTTSMPIRSGDIIRIDQLLLYTDFVQKFDLAKSVTFESFSDKSFELTKSSNNEEIFCIFDKKRVKELIDFNVKNILNQTVIERGLHTYSVESAVFQVLCTLKHENRIIIACWNGNPFDEYPCMQLIKVQQIIDTLNSVNKQHVYNENFIRKLYNEYKIVFISVYGLHRVVAITLRPLDTIVVYNLLIKYDKFNYGMHSYIMHDGLLYGRCIRAPDYESEIAIALRMQIETNCIFNNSLKLESYQFDKSLSQINSFEELNNSKRQKLDKDAKSKISHSTIIFSNTLDDSDITNEFNKIPCNHFEYSPVENNIIYRNFYSNKNPIFKVERVKRIDDIINDDQIKYFDIEAKFHSFLFKDDYLSQIFNSMSSLRKFITMIQCNSNECDYQDHFANFMENNTLYKEIDGRLVKMNESSETSENTEILKHLQCPKCQTLNCILCLDFAFFLQDYDNILLLVQLTGDEANSFFSCSTIDLCSNKSDLLKTIPAMLKFMYHITNDSSECLQKITWTLKSSGEKEQRQYRMIGASILAKSFACGTAL